ncbi:MAG: coenzyme F420-0:L-glutamate ligase [Bacillota bacterium]
MKVELFGLALPEVRPGDDLAALLAESARTSCGGLQAGDVLVVTSKVISKAKGYLVELARVQPSAAARRLAARTGLDARFVDVVLRQSQATLFVVPLAEFMREGIVEPAQLGSDPQAVARLIERFPYEIFTLRNGDVYSSAGVDASNHPAGEVSYPPPDPDQAARELAEGVRRMTGLYIPVIVTDTEYTLGLGTQDVARGSYGIKPAAGKFGAPDRLGKPKFGGADLVTHELASAAALIMGQTAEGFPAVLVRGFPYEPFEGGMAGYRPAPEKVRPIVRLTLSHSVRVLGWRWLLGLAAAMLAGRRSRPRAAPYPSGEATGKPSTSSAL